MRIGVISDPHGCLVGLRASLDWLRDAGVDRIVCAGDVANFGPQSNECIALLVERNIPCAQGNCDRDILLPPRSSQHTDERTAQLNTIDAWCKERLGAASREWLAALPPRLAPAPDVMIVHGSVRELDEIVDADAHPAFPVGATAVAAGHLHKPFIIRVDQRIWVNAGSAGRPCDGDPRAAVAILEQQAEHWTASVHRVPFDLDAAARAILEADMPYAQRSVETQRKACWW